MITQGSVAVVELRQSVTFIMLKVLCKQLGDQGRIDTIKAASLFILTSDSLSIGADVDHQQACRCRHGRIQ